MRDIAAWGDREPYAVCMSGAALNPAARYEALAMYDQRDTNGHELRAVAGKLLFRQAPMNLPAATPARAFSIDR